MVYAKRLDGNLPAVNRNAESSMKGLKQLIDVVQARVRLDLDYARKCSVSHALLDGDLFAGHPGTSAAVARFTTFLHAGARRAERWALALQSDVLDPLRRLQQDAEWRYRALLKQAKALEHEKDRNVERVAHAKQTYLRISREAEDQKANVEKMLLDRAYPKSSLGRLCHRAQTLEQEARRSEGVFRDVSEGLQRNLRAVYSSRAGSLLGQLEALDIVLLQALHHSLHAAVAEFGTLHNQFQADFDALRVSVDDWDPVADTSIFAERHARSVEEDVQACSFEPYSAGEVWSTEACNYDLTPASSRSPLELIYPVLELPTVDQVQQDVLAALQADLVPEGLDAVRRQCDAVAEFIRANGSHRRICMRLSVRASAMRHPAEWNDGIEVVVKTADWEPWCTVIHVTEDGVQDAGWGTARRRDLDAVSPVQPIVVPPDLLLAFQDFLKTLTFVKSPPHSPAWARNPQNFKEDDDSDWVLADGRSRGLSSLCDAATSAKDDAASVLRPQNESRAESSTTGCAAALSVANRESLPGVPEHLTQLLKSHAGRLALGRALTTQRVEAVGLDEPSFHRLLAVILVAFDCCAAQDDDARAASILLNMCHTFHCPTLSTENIYLQACIKDHPLFRSDRFWREAFMAALITEQQKQHPAGGRSWRELSPAGRLEIERREHHIAFSQLLSFVFNMTCMGVPPASVRKFLDHFSSLHGLSSEQRDELLAHAPPGT